MEKLVKFIQSPLYWLAVIFVGFGLEGVALFYQHVLNEPPCAMCIHARVWVIVGILSAFFGLAARRFLWLRMAGHAGIIVGLVGLLERSWLSVMVERGLVESECGMDPGFPSWLPLDVWIPNMFEVWTFCGYTPNFLFGTTMGEALVAGSVLLIAIAAFAAVIDFKHR